MLSAWYTYNYSYVAKCPWPLPSCVAPNDKHRLFNMHSHNCNHSHSMLLMNSFTAYGTLDYSPETVTWLINPVKIPHVTVLTAYLKSSDRIKINNTWLMAVAPSTTWCIAVAPTSMWRHAHGRQAPVKCSREAAYEPERTFMMAGTQCHRTCDHGCKPLWDGEKTERPMLTIIIHWERALILPSHAYTRSESMHMCVVNTVSTMIPWCLLYTVD